MLSIQPISFRGKLMRETHYVGDRTSPTGSRTIETTPEELKDSYDRQIKKIIAYKQFALKLDDLMYKDDDIQNRIAALPEDMEIEVAGNFGLKYSEDDHEVMPDAPVLIASYDPSETSDGEAADAIEEAYYLEYDKKAPNKEAIIKWLDDIKELSNRN